MRGIDATQFKSGIQVEYRQSIGDFLAKTPEYYKTVSEHGSSRANVTCGFCDRTSEVYIHSFFGCGKKCNGCGALITYGHTHVELKYMNKGQLIALYNKFYPGKHIDATLKKVDMVDFIKGKAINLEVTIL